jgi:pyrophosphate--fructose-6-phosphate 1-phosphotransferase
MGYAAALLCSEGATGYCAAVHGTTRDVSEWRIGGVPLSAMLAAKPKGGIEITSQGVDLAGNSFSEFEEKRREWAATDCFRNPGPIQFDAMTRPVSLVADTAGMDELTTKVATMCDQIKDSLVGASAEYLHTAEVSLATLQKVLAIVGKHEAALEPMD